MLVGFTAVYREGFETALFYQALLSFGTGPRRLDRSPASSLGIVALAVVAWLMFRLGRKVPIKTFMNDRGGAGDGDERRLPRQRGARAAGRRSRRRSPRSPDGRGRRSSSPRRPATGRPCRRSPRRSPSQPSTSSGGMYVFLVEPRLAKRHRRTAPDRGRPPLPRVEAAGRWQSGSASTSEERSPKPWRSISRPGSSPSRCCRRRTMPRKVSRRASCSASPTSRADVGADQHRARHPLDDPGGERAARGRRRAWSAWSGWDAVPSSRKARKRTELSKVELSAGKHLATRSGVPRRHRRPARCRDPGRAANAAATTASSAIATAEAFAPDDASNETRSRRWPPSSASRRARRPTSPACTGSSCAR